MKCVEQVNHCLRSFTQSTLLLQLGLYPLGEVVKLLGPWESGPGRLWGVTASSPYPLGNGVKLPQVAAVTLALIL